MSPKNSSRKIRTAGGENVVSVQAEIRDNVEQERQKRYAREVKQSAETEDALANLSRFAYQPVDYAPALVRKQWVEPAIPDFGYILEEARLRVANNYFATIVLQLLAGLCFVLLALAFRDSIVAVVGIVGLAGSAIALNRELQSRRRDMDRALAAARALVAHSGLTAPEIARRSLEIAADICVYTNHHITVEEL